jgi:hypothetical protein
MPRRVASGSTRPAKARAPNVCDWEESVASSHPQVGPRNRKVPGPSCFWAPEPAGEAWQGSPGLIHFQLERSFSCRRGAGLPVRQAYSTSIASEIGELFINPASAAWSRKAAQRAGFVSNSPDWRWPDRRFRPMLRGLTRLVPPRLSTSQRTTYTLRLSDGTRLRPSLTNPQMPSNPKNCL